MGHVSLQHGRVSYGGPPLPSLLRTSHSTSITLTLRPTCRELYWSISYADTVGVADSWINQWVAGGNGDGTLVYRGTPAHIGGTSEVPIASVRLKAIRDGQEDLLWMSAAEAAAGRAAVLSAITPLITAGFAFADDPAALAAARDTLGDLAEQLGTL